MTNGVMAFLVGMSFAVWVYGKLMRSTGNNTKSSAIAAIISGLCIWLITFLLLGLIPK